MNISIVQDKIFRLSLKRKPSREFDSEVWICNSYELLLFKDETTFVLKKTGRYMGVFSMEGNKGDTLLRKRNPEI